MAQINKNEELRNSLDGIARLPVRQMVFNWYKKQPEHTDMCLQLFCVSYSVFLRSSA